MLVCSEVVAGGAAFAAMHVRFVTCLNLQTLLGHTMSSRNFCRFVTLIMHVDITVQEFEKYEEHQGKQVNHGFAKVGAVNWTRMCAC